MTRDDNAQTGHTRGLPATESAVRGSRVLPDPARVARYVEAIETAWIEVGGWEGEALAAVAVADEEHAALVAEVERLREHKTEWREVAHTNKRQWMDAIARAEAAETLADQLGERVAYYRDSEIPALRSNADGWAARADAAEAKVAKVEALADEHWLDPANFGEPLASVLRTLQRRLSAILYPQPEWTPERIARLRAALADAPAAAEFAHKYFSDAAAEQRAEGGA